MQSHSQVLEAPTPNSLDLSSIHPSRAGKFSPNLHRWLSSRKDLAQYAKVYRGEDGVFMIGYIDGGDFIGARLMQVLCFGAKAKCACYSSAALALTEFDDFWSLYSEKGRCVIDPEHNQAFIGDRFNEAGDSRTCLWCEKLQRRIRSVAQVVCERWE